MFFFTSDLIFATKNILLGFCPNRSTLDQPKWIIVLRALHQIILQMMIKWKEIACVIFCSTIFLVKEFQVNGKARIFILSFPIGKLWWGSHWWCVRIINKVRCWWQYFATIIFCTEAVWLFLFGYTDLLLPFWTFLKTSTPPVSVMVLVPLPLPLLLCGWWDP